MRWRKAYLPGIGTFAAIEDKDGNATVVFAPDESFSESVNEPFAMFEPVELSDNAALDIAASEVQPPLQSSTDNGTTTPLSDDRHDDSAETDISAIPSDAATPKEPQQTAAATVTTERMPTGTPEITGAENTAPVSTAVPMPAPLAPTAPAAPSRQYRLGWLCLGIAIGAIIGYLVAALVYTNREMSDNEEYGDTYEETAEYTDSVISVTDASLPIVTTLRSQQLRISFAPILSQSDAISHIWPRTITATAISGYISMRPTKMC